MQPTTDMAADEAGPARRRGNIRMRLVVAGVLALLLLATIDWRASVSVLMRAHGGVTALAFAILLAGVVVSVAKWRLLLGAAGVAAPFPVLMRSYLVGQFASSFLPSNVGGDVVRLRLTHRLGPPGAVLGSIVAERFSGLLTALLLACLALISEPELPHEFLEHVAVGGGVVALVAGALAMVELARPGRLPVLQALRRHPRGARLMAAAGRAHAQLVALARRPALCAACFALSLLFYVLLGAFQYVAIRALGLDVAVLDAARIAPLVAVVSALPVSVNGLGVAEAAFVFLYSQAGLSPPQALAAAVLRRLVIMAVALLGGIIAPFVRAAPLPGG